MNGVPLILYFAACLAYAVHFAQRDPRAGRLATTLLLAAALAHTFVIGMQTMEVRHVPYANPSRAISTFVWMLALAYLYIEVTTEERAMGVFMLPLAVALQVIPTMDPGIERADPLLDSGWFWIHTLSLLFAYASFALAGILGLTYVLQFKEIKKKQLGYFYQRLPSLQMLDLMNSRVVTVGWICMTVGVIVGGIWATQARAAMPYDTRLQAFSFGDPKIFVAVVTWAVYSFAVIARRTMGWHGRRPALLSAVGFGIVLLNFLPISYFITTSHSF
jgi:ABC-type transport system involved in cytochrome c biogenesis permease subunit